MGKLFHIPPYNLSGRLVVRAGRSSGFRRVREPDRLAPALLERDEHLTPLGRGVGWGEIEETRHIGETLGAKPLIAPADEAAGKLTQHK